MRRFAPLLAVTAAVVGAPAAHASELAAVAAEAEYRAAAGETNALVVSPATGTTVVRDTGALITVSAFFCSQSDPHTALCPTTTISGLPEGIPGRIAALLGDGDDSGVAVGNRMLITLQGGDGNDRLTVGEPATPLNGPVEAFGDAGDDTLAGGTGREILRGGTGADALAGGDNGDLLDGGDDADVLIAGAGTDRLIGGGGDDRLDAGAEDDRTDAGEGDDFVVVGDADIANGGKGNDSLVASGAGAATMGCGAGRDRIVPSRHDRVALSCERIAQVVTCGAGRACRVEAVLSTAARRVLATVTKRIRAGGSRTLELTFSRKVRKEIRRRGHIALTLRIKALTGAVTGPRRTPLTIRAREPIP
jgi:Ca2+-binding RTX toxin-like protein